MNSGKYACSACVALLPYECREVHTRAGGGPCDFCGELGCGGPLTWEQAARVLLARAATSGATAGERAAFFRAVDARLNKGEVAYGEKSFSRSPLEILGELEEEALDFGGWGFVLWKRLQRVKDALRQATGGLPQ